MEGGEKEWPKLRPTSRRMGQQERVAPITHTHTPPHMGRITPGVDHTMREHTTDRHQPPPPLGSQLLLRRTNMTITGTSLVQINKTLGHTGQNAARK